MFVEAVSKTFLQTETNLHPLEVNNTFLLNQSLVFFYPFVKAGFIKKKKKLLKRTRKTLIFGQAVKLKVFQKTTQTLILANEFKIKGMDSLSKKTSMLCNWHSFTYVE